jgi:hypothetical protein
MNHKQIIKSSIDVLKNRSETYGSEEMCFKRISDIATIVLNKSISEYDVAMIMLCVKMGRLQEDRQNLDHYVDSVNYLAFAAQFSGSQNSVVTAMMDDMTALAQRSVEKSQTQSRKWDGSENANEPQNVGDHQVSAT